MGALACSPAGSTRGDGRRPNVLVLMADDQSHGTLSSLGHPHLSTPAIDRIAREGAAFTNAFVTTSLCSPSRVSFLTGQYVRTHGVLTNAQPFPKGATTFATELAGAGYETACFGKWHMGVGRGPRPGFEYAATYDGQGQYQDCTFQVGVGSGERRATSGFVDDASPARRR